jgi:hypothetical protein
VGAQPLLGLEVLELEASAARVTALAFHRWSCKNDMAHLLGDGEGEGAV